MSKGKFPEDFGGQWVGDGGQRVAWLCGDYVIKERVPAWHLDLIHNDHAVVVARRDLFAVPHRAFHRVGLLPPQQWYEGVWVVQPFYRPLTTLERERWRWVNDESVYHYVMHQSKRVRVKLELHTKNIGVYAPTGTIHVFDW